MGASTGTRIPLCVPEIRGNEWTYIKACLDTGWVSSVGSFVDRFERDLAAYIGVRKISSLCNKIIHCSWKMISMVPVHGGLTILATSMFN